MRNMLFGMACLLNLYTLALAAEPVRYVALGDSYTIGTGASTNEAWPSIVSARLNEKGVPIVLAANLARNGWTTQDVLERELPVFRELHADFATVLIGANDWVRGVNEEFFEQRFAVILDELLKTLKPENILVITIPDFSVTPTGREYGSGRDIARGLARFNQIIVREAGQRRIKTVDLYPLSQEMASDPSYISSDGLHPSAKGYARWSDLIEPSFLAERK